MSHAQRTVAVASIETVEAIHELILDAQALVQDLERRQARIREKLDEASHRLNGWRGRRISPVEPVERPAA